MSLRGGFSFNHPKEKINFYAKEKNSGKVHLLVEDVTDSHEPEYDLESLINNMQKRLASGETDTLTIFDQDPPLQMAECDDGSFTITKAMTSKKIEKINAKNVERSEEGFCRVE